MTAHHAPAAWFPVETRDARAVEPCIERLASGALGAVVALGVAPEAELHALSARLDAGAFEVTPTRFAQEFEALSYGPCLDQSEGDVAGYLARVRAFEVALSRASPTLDLAAVVLSTLRRAAGRLPVERPVGPAGEPYAFVTLRALPPGGLIPPHCENEQLPRAAYQALRPRLDGRTLLSFYLTLRPAELGGELSVHDLGVEAIGGRQRHGHSALGAEVARAPSVRLSLPAGALVLFDGGRRFHQVLPVGGARARWTLGGFAALSAARDRVWVWA